MLYVLDAEVRREPRTQVSTETFMNLALIIGYLAYKTFVFFVGLFGCKAETAQWKERLVRC